MNSSGGHILDNPSLASDISHWEYCIGLSTVEQAGN